MDIFKISMITGAIVLPFFVTFGLNVLRRVFRFINRHEIVSVAEDVDCIIDDYYNEEYEQRRDFEAQLKAHYVDELYC